MKPDIKAIRERAERATVRVTTYHAIQEFHQHARTDIPALCDRVEELEAALRWALPLANLALEDCRIKRLSAGHNDIGKGTSRLGLWPSEQKEFAKARAALDGGDA